MGNLLNYLKILCLTFHRGKRFIFFRFYTNTDAAVQMARIELKQGENTLITTSISGKKINMNSISGLKLFISVLFLPVITLIRINVQAAKLWLKGIKLVKKE